MEVRKLGKLTITDEGDVFNHEENYMLSIFKDAQGNPKFHNPETNNGMRIDYAVAMLFLNDGKFIESFSDYYIEHIDGNPLNCKLSNLKIITDKDEVKEIRFGHLAKVRQQIMFTPIYLANRRTFEIKVCSINDLSREYNIGPTAIANRAKNCEPLIPGKYELFVCETMLEAWECLE